MNHEMVKKLIAKSKHEITPDFLIENSNYDVGNIMQLLLSIIKEEKEVIFKEPTENDIERIYNKQSDQPELDEKLLDLQELKKYA